MEQSIKDILADDFWIMPATPEYIDEGVPYITSKNIKNGIIDFTKVNYISQDAYENISKNRPILVGDILISMIGTLGETAEVKESDGSFYGQNMFLVRLDQTKINKRYFLNFFKSNCVKRALEGKQNQSTQKYLKANHIEDLIIPVPALDEQKLIAEQLDKLACITALRNEELKYLDDLIKARFVEMFGDPQLNPFKWDVVNISEVIGGKVSNGFFTKRDDYTDTGNVSVLGVANIVNRMYSKIDDLPRTNADDKDIEKFAVNYGDMLFCRSSLVAEGIGKASIVPKDVQENVLFECHVIRLPLDLRKCVPEFMQTLSTMDYYRNQVIAQAKTATMTTIGQDGILKTEIILPPIEKQKEFYEFVKQVDKSKVEVQKALDETQKLFDSLMQEYFG